MSFAIEFSKEENVAVCQSPYDADWQLVQAQKSLHIDDTLLLYPNPNPSFMTFFSFRYVLERTWKYVRAFSSNVDFQTHFSNEPQFHAYREFK